MFTLLSYPGGSNSRRFWSRFKSYLYLHCSGNGNCSVRRAASAEASVSPHPRFASRADCRVPREGNPSPVPPGVVYGAQPGPPGGFAETRGGRVLSVERRGPGTLRVLQRVCFTFGFPRGAGRALRLPALARALVLVGVSRFAESPRLPQPPVPRGDGPGGPRACRCDVPPAACPRPRTSPDVTQAPALLRLGGWGGATPPAAPES